MEQKKLLEKKAPYIERRINEVDWYNSQRDQDFETLVNYTQNEVNTPDKEANLLLEMAKGKSNQSPADIRSVLSTTVKPGSAEKPRVSFSDPNILSKLDNKVTIIDGNKYLKINVTYHISMHENSSHQSSLLDRGANGGVCGADMTVIGHTGRYINLRGLDNHEVNELEIVSCAAVTTSQQGPVLLVFHQYANYGKGKSIHSSGQLEHYGNYVNDKSRKIQGGRQLIKTLDGYLFPLQIKSGLPYLNIRKPTDEELRDLPSVVMTSAQRWDPKILDSEIPVDATNWYDSSDVKNPGFFD